MKFKDDDWLLDLIKLLPLKERLIVEGNRREFNKGFELGSLAVEAVLFSDIRKFGIKKALEERHRDLICGIPHSRSGNWYKAEFL